MFNVLFLLAITSGFLESLNDQTSSGGFELNGSNTVGNGKLDTETETLIFKGSLGNIVLNLLGGDTERTDLLGKSITGTFTTDSTDVNCSVKREILITRFIKFMIIQNSNINIKIDNKKKIRNIFFWMDG